MNPGVSIVGICFPVIKGIVNKLWFRKDYKEICNVMNKNICKYSLTQICVPCKLNSSSVIQANAQGILRESDVHAIPITMQ